MIEVTDDYTANKVEFLNILKSNQAKNIIVENDPILKLATNVFSTKDGDINLSYDDIVNIFNSEMDINIITLKVNKIEEGLSFIAQAKEVNKLNSLCFHFFLNSNFKMIDLSDAMEIIYESASNEANIAFCISSEENRAMNEIGINLFYSLK